MSFSCIKSNIRLILLEKKQSVYMSSFIIIKIVQITKMNYNLKKGIRIILKKLV